MKERARSLRQDITLAENRMWYFLRNRRLKGYKFVREYVIDRYIADFFFAVKRDWSLKSMDLNILIPLNMINNVQNI